MRAELWSQRQHVGQPAAEPEWKQNTKQRAQSKRCADVQRCVLWSRLTTAPGQVCRWLSALLRVAELGVWWDFRDSQVARPVRSPPPCVRSYTVSAATSDNWDVMGTWGTLIFIAGLWACVLLMYVLIVLSTADRNLTFMPFFPSILTNNIPHTH